MPYPTAAVADPVTYKNSAGVTVPALAASADGGSGVISLFVDDPAGAYFVHVVPKDLTGARFNSWNWPAGAGATPGGVSPGGDPAVQGLSFIGDVTAIRGSTVYLQGISGGLGTISISGDLVGSGNIETSATAASGHGIILKSPDGTRWKLAVANTTGALTAVLA